MRNTSSRARRRAPSAGAFTAPPASAATAPPPRAPRLPGGATPRAAPRRGAGRRPRGSARPPDRSGGRSSRDPVGSLAPSGLPELQIEQVPELVALGGEVAPVVPRRGDADRQPSNDRQPVRLEPDQLARVVGQEL